MNVDTKGTPNIAKTTKIKKKIHNLENNTKFREVGSRYSSFKTVHRRCSDDIVQYRIAY